MDDTDIIRIKIFFINLYISKMSDSNDEDLARYKTAVDDVDVSGKKKDMFSKIWRFKTVIIILVITLILLLLINPKFIKKEVVQKNPDGTDGDTVLKTDVGKLIKWWLIFSVVITAGYYGYRFFKKGKGGKHSSGDDDEEVCSKCGNAV